MFNLKNILRKCFIHTSFPYRANQLKKLNCGQYLLTFSRSTWLDVSLTFLSFSLKADPIHLSRWLSLSLLCFLYDLLSFLLQSSVDMPVTLPLCFPSSIFLPHHLSWQCLRLHYRPLFNSYKLKTPFWQLMCSLLSTEHGISCFIFTS